MFMLAPEGVRTPICLASVGNFHGLVCIVGRFCAWATTRRVVEGAKVTELDVDLRPDTSTVRR
jgi:hypothetical protein